ncbi:MAG: leucyl/phenylalanyl-tRNA--protein transferase [Pseudomonadota bacterium]
MATSENEVLYPPRSRVRDASTGNWPIPRETLGQTVKRTVLAGAYTLRPKRLPAIPSMLIMWLRYAFGSPESRAQLPNPEDRLSRMDDLAGMLGRRETDHIVEGFRRGMHLSGHVMPPKWLAPNAICLLMPGRLHIQKNMARILRSDRYRFTFDRDPIGVLSGCAAPRDGRVPLTWLHPGMMAVMLDLYDDHVMHTLEVWNKDCELVGGLFGYAVDETFLLESMFHTERDTSKLATIALAAQLESWGFAAIDGDVQKSHLASLGFESYPRGMKATLSKSKPNAPWGRWRFDDRLDLGNWKPADGPCPLKPAVTA